MAAACTLSRDGKSREYFLSEMCTGDQMYADRDIIHLPANEFAMVCALNEQYMFFGRNEYVGEDGKTQVALTYPVKICNIAHRRERWQVDTPMLVPEFNAKAELSIGVLRMGYIVFNSWDWADIILRSRTRSLWRSLPSRRAGE